MLDLEKAVVRALGWVFVNGHGPIMEVPLEQRVLAVVEQDLEKLLAFFKQTPGYWYVIGCGGKHMIVETNRPLR